MPISMTKEELHEAIDEAIDKRLAARNQRDDQVLIILERMEGSVGTLVETAKSLQSDVKELVRLHKQFKRSIM